MDNISEFLYEILVIWDGIYNQLLGYIDKFLHLNPDSFFRSRLFEYFIFLAFMAVFILALRDILRETKKGVYDLATKSRFRYPYFYHHFDVSGKRNPKMDDWVDNFLIEDRFETIQNHQEEILYWKKQCEEKLERGLMKKRRRMQYLNCLDDEHAFRFTFDRKRTRYKGTESWMQPSGEYTYSYEDLAWRYDQLKEIKFQCSLNDYHVKDQRRLMTRELREEIMRRDNFTCQMCGKYMPDEVGLQIDHIIPVSKGGKSVKSNLQVLCNKCNARKSGNVPE